MKIDIDLKKIKKYFEKNKNAFFYLTGLLFFILVALSVYSVLSLQADQTVTGDGNKKINEATINFDKKYLEGLKDKKSPTEINQSGGRNPFLSF